MDSRKYKLPSGRAEVDLNDGAEIKYPQRKLEIVDALREALTELNRLENENRELLKRLEE